jgi:hypothetical protein
VLCRCGSTSYEGEMPLCAVSACLRRWWAVVGIPFLLLIAGVLSVGLHAGPDASCEFGCRIPAAPANTPARHVNGNAQR